MAENIDFAAVLAVLEAKRAALDALIGSYRAALSLGALGQLGEDHGTIGGSGKPQTLGGPPMELPTGAFLNKSIPAAIKLYLSAMRRKLTAKEIATALKEGGVESTSDNFEAVVAASLQKLKGSGDVLRFKDGWALAEFYPAHLRTNLGSTKNGAAPAAKKRAAKAKAKKKAAAKKGAAPKPAAADDGGPSLRERVHPLRHKPQ